MLRRRILCCFIAASFAVILLIMDIRGMAFGPKGLSEGDPVKISGTIASKEEKNGGTRYYVSFYTDSYYSYYTYFDLENDDLILSSHITLRGNISELNTASNEGSYDEKAACLGKGIFFSLSDVEVIETDPPRLAIKETLYDLRQDVKSVYEYHLPGEEPGLLSAMALGDKADLISEAKNLFYMCGLAHILCVSGTHISMLAGSLHRFLKRIGTGLAPSALIAGIAAVAYCLLSGSQTSCVRAVGMFLIMLVADVTGQAYDPLTALFIMAMAQFINEPYIIYSSSFQFSYIALLGIHMIALPLKQVYDDYCRERYTGPGGWEPSLIQIVVRQVIVSLSITAVTLPLIAYYYYEIPVYSMLISLILMPAFGLLLGCGIVGGLAGIPLAALAYLPMKLCHFILYAYELIADKSLALPYARWITGKPAIWIMLGYWALLLTAKILICHIALWERRNLKKYSRDIRKRSRIRHRASLTIAGCAAVMMVCMIVFCCLPKKENFEVVFIDVGQGDGIYISSGNGLDIMIDGGSTSYGSVGTYEILPFLKSRGVRKIDYWFISHLDQDHYNGMLEVLESGYRVDRLLIPEVMLNGESTSIIKSAAQANGTEIIAVSAGDCLKSGEEFSLECLYPGRTSSYTDTNDNSMVLRLTYGDFDAVFAGDLSSEVEEEIADEVFDGIDRLELLKISHHGSNYSSSELWLETASPELAVISCGVNNYGHPGEETLARLEALNIPYLITLETGEIRVTEGVVIKMIDTRGNIP